MEHYWLDIAKKLQSLAQAGLAYSENKYDLERYEELRSLSVEIMSKYTDLESDRIKDLFANETGYQTPKVDIRAVIFKESKVLMVKEQIDGCWSLPGGWADIGYTPAEVAVKEVREEAGFDVKPVRVLAILDRKCHPHPPSPYHIYKVFILCEVIGGTIKTGIETSEAAFFERNALPELSVDRNTESQVRMMFEFLDDPNKTVMFD
jgi:ADP-ribose pyrophosphatase YjhB (NUDIX family)